MNTCPSCGGRVLSSSLAVSPPIPITECVKCGRKTKWGEVENEGDMKMSSVWVVMEGTFSMPVEDNLWAVMASEDRVFNAIKDSGSPHFQYLVWVADIGQVGHEGDGYIIEIIDGVWCKKDGGKWVAI